VGERDDQLNPSGQDRDLCDRLVNPDNILAIIPKKEKDDPEGLGCGDPPDPYCDDNEPANVGRLSAYYFALDESNDEPCTIDRKSENSCKVRIVTTGYFHNWKTECKEPKCGRRIGLRAYGHVLPAEPPENEVDPIEINPFTRDQTIWVEELTVFFMGIGTNRSEANCYYDNREYEDGEWTGRVLEENIVFRTFCVGTRCRQLEPPQ